MSILLNLKTKIMPVKCPTWLPMTFWKTEAIATMKQIAQNTLLDDLARLHCVSQTSITDYF